MRQISIGFLQKPYGLGIKNRCLCFLQLFLSLFSYKDTIFAIFNRYLQHSLKEWTIYGSKTCDKHFNNSLVIPSWPLFFVMHASFHWKMPHFTECYHFYYISLTHLIKLTRLKRSIQQLQFFEKNIVWGKFTITGLITHGCKVFGW